MKAFLKNIILFFVFCLSGYMLLIVLFAFGLIDKTNSNLVYTPFEGKNNIRMLEVETEYNVDILFIGSSHAYRTFDTRKYERLGWNSFNMGSSSQTHIQTNYLLENYLNEMNPEVVVYEVFPEIFMADGTESTINLISSSKNMDIEIFDMAINSGNVKAFNSVILNMFLNLFELKDNLNSELKEPTDDKYVVGGYVEKKLEFNLDPSPKPKSWNPNEEQLEYFQRNLKLIKNNGAQIILVQAPHTFTYLNNKDVDNFFNKLGIYYNFNKIVEFQKVLDFYDSHHVNRFGVEKINSKLIDILIKGEYL